MPRVKRLTKVAEAELRKLVTDHNNATALAKRLAEISAGFSSSNLYNLQTTHATANSFYDNSVGKVFLTNDAGVVVNQNVFEHDEGDDITIEESFGLVANFFHNYAREIDPKAQLLKKLIKYQMQSIRDEGAQDQRAYKVKVLKNLVGLRNGSKGFKDLVIGTGHEDSFEFVQPLLEAMYDDFPIFSRTTTDLGSVTTRPAKLESIDVPSTETSLEILLVSREFADTRATKLLVDPQTTEIVFHLKRFTSPDGTPAGGKKVTTNVPLDDIHLSRSDNPEETQKFQVTSFVCHSGNLNGGHYITYVKEQDGWYCYNDGAVSKVEDKNAKSAQANAYVVKYSLETAPLPQRQHGANNLTGNMCWANAAAAFVGSFTSFVSQERITLHEDELRILSDELASEELSTKTKDVSATILNERIEGLLKTRAELTQQNNLNPATNKTEEPIGLGVTKSATASHKKSERLAAINKKVFEGGDEGKRLSALEVALKKSEIEVRVKDLDETERKSLLEPLLLGNNPKNQDRAQEILSYAAQGVLTKAIKEKEAEEKTNKKITASDWKDNGAKKAHFGRFNRVDFESVDLSASFRSTFTKCHFDKDCALPTDPSSLDAKYFRNCTFDPALFADDKNKDLKQSLLEGGYAENNGKLEPPSPSPSKAAVFRLMDGVDLGRAQ